MTIKIITIISSGLLCISVAVVKHYDQKNIERKGFIFVYSSRERVCDDKGSMDVSNRIGKLTDHISMYTQEVEKGNSRGRKTYKPQKPIPSALHPLNRLHLQRFHSLPKECHQLGTICSNTKVHDIFLIYTTSTYLALYFKGIFAQSPYHQGTTMKERRQ